MEEGARECYGVQWELFMSKIHTFLVSFTQEIVMRPLRVYQLGPFAFSVWSYLPTLRSVGSSKRNFVYFCLYVWERWRWDVNVLKNGQINYIQLSDLLQCLILHKEHKRRNESLHKANRTEMEWVMHQASNVTTHTKMKGRHFMRSCKMGLSILDG